MPPHANRQLIVLLVVLITSVAIIVASITTFVRCFATKERLQAGTAATIAIKRATVSPESAAKVGIRPIARSLDTREGAVILTVRLINDSNTPVSVRDGDTLQVATQPTLSETAVHVHPLGEAVLEPNGHMDVQVPLPNDKFVEVRYISGGVLGGSKGTL